MSRYKIYLYCLAVTFIGFVGNFVYQQYQGEYGAGYRPVTGYEARLTSFLDDVTASTTINVNSTKDVAGVEIVLADISPAASPKAFFNLESGTPREEIVFCTGKSVNQWTSCTRGLSFQGGSLTASSTLAKDHNAGSKIIMTNVGQFYGEFVSTNGAETITGVKTFDSLPVATSTSANPTTNDQLVTKFYADALINSGLTAAAVSTTLGLEAFVGLTNCSTTGTCIGFNASSTGALAFTAVTGDVYVNVSSTDSNDGGFLKHTFGTLNRIYWDVVSFLAHPWTWTGAQTFSGVTQATIGPSSTLDVVNYGSLVGNNATGTAGGTITRGVALRVGGDGLIYTTSANATNTVYEFIGVSLSATTASGQQITYARPGGIVTGLSGLTADRAVYLGDSPTSLSNTPGTITARVGRALSATSMLVLSPSYYNRKSGSQNLDTVGTVVSIATVWQPTKINLYCGGNVGNSVGQWTAQSSGGSSAHSIGYDATDDTAFQSATLPCNWEESTNIFTVSVATSTAGFTLTLGGTSADRTILWDAERNDDYDSH